LKEIAKLQKYVAGLVYGFNEHGIN
jgi:hypothetical protein